MPEVGAPDVSLGGEQRGEHRGLSAPDNKLSQHSLETELVTCQ